MIRTDDEGGELWSQTYGGGGDEVSYSAIQTEVGGFALAGISGSIEEGTGDFLLIRTAPDPVNAPIIVKPPLPNEFFLLAPYPNPFNSSITISYGLPVAALVSLQLYDIAGQKIKTMVNGCKQTGAYSATLKAANMPSGLYMVRLEASDQMIIQKIMLIR